MLNIISNGHIPPFITKPKLGRVPLIHSGCKTYQKNPALASCIQFSWILRKGGNVKSRGFYSHLFLVPKPHQRWRSVRDLSRLNTFLLVERFKWKHQSLSGPLIPGEWGSSIDLSDAYPNIPINPNSRKYVRFATILRCSSSLPSLSTEPRPLKSLQ